VILSNHESLKHLKRQGKLSRIHAKWVEFIETFMYVIKYKQGKKILLLMHFHAGMYFYLLWMLDF
jgi:hypothetical protein